MVKEIQDKNFQQEVISHDGTVVVDFWAPWCGPCKMLSPVIDEIAEELSGKVKFTKVNVDNNPVVSSSFRIASIPTVMIFKDGKVVDTMVGFRPKESIKMMIQKHV